MASQVTVATETTTAAATHKLKGRSLSGRHSRAARAMVTGKASLRLKLPGAHSTFQVFRWSARWGIHHRLLIRGLTAVHSGAQPCHHWRQTTENTSDIVQPLAGDESAIGAPQHTCAVPDHQPGGTNDCKLHTAPSSPEGGLEGQEKRQEHHSSIPADSLQDRTTQLSRFRGDQDPRRLHPANGDGGHMQGESQANIQIATVSGHGHRRGEPYGQATPCDASVSDPTQEQHHPIAYATDNWTGAHPTAYVETHTRPRGCSGDGSHQAAGGLSSVGTSTPSHTKESTSHKHYTEAA